MKNPSEMTKTQLFMWAKKTALSAAKHMGRGGSMNSPRSWNLVDRYAALKDEMVERGVWQEYCDGQGWCSSHDAYDNFA